MINQGRLQMTSMEFAAGRDKTLGDAEEFLLQFTRRAMVRIGLPQWYGNLVEGMMQVFDMTVAMETDQISPTIDDMRREFRREIMASLDLAKQADNKEAQFERINRWAATASVNGAVEAATTADPDERVGLEWITMGDEKVRHSHKEVNGATVPSGQPFSVGGQDMLYPGQPVGDPSEFLNCRCVVRPAMLGEMAGMNVATFANQSDPQMQTGDTSVVIVALPRVGDPVLGVASGDHPHITLAYLGNVEPSQFEAAVQAAAEVTYHPITDKVSGRGELGEDQADVLLLDASGSKGLREMLLADAAIADAVATADSFPTWIPHITVGYPDAPRLSDDKPEDVTYDRFAIWQGDNMHEYPFNIEESQEPDAVIASGEVVSAEQLPDDIDIEFDEMIPDEEVLTQVPWHGVLAPEGIPSGDGRQFAKLALTTRRLPLPLKWMPSDKQGHDDSVIVGRIDRVFRNKQGFLCAEGMFDTSENAYEAIRQIANSMLRGVSVDLDEMSGAVEIPREGNRSVVELAAAVVASATLCAIPAFSEAYVALGHWDEAEEPSGDSGEFAPVPRETKDGPGWITHPGETKHITNYWVDGRGAAKIAWGTPGDFDRCRANLAKYVKNPKWLAGLCANLHYRALRTWPGQDHSIIASGGEAAPAFNLVASAGIEPYNGDDFRNPGFDKPTPLTVTDDGRVFGHLAAWGTCHIGVRGVCTTPPTSRSKYGYFLTGEVPTTAGPVNVGQITMGGGHADIRKNARAAMAHYDATSTVVADVTAGEDAHGIWVAGHLRSTVTPEESHALRAAALSGDWRQIRGSLEMVAALAVNVPGFPIPRTEVNASSEAQYALTASAIVVSDVEVNAITDEVGIEPSVDSRLDRVHSARQTFRTIRAAKARSAII